jgi:hypothetical protein
VRASESPILLSMLSDVERERLVAALHAWARTVPDEPVAGFLGDGRLLTPRELANAAEQDTPDGEALLQILEHGVRREGLGTVVERLTARREMEMEA